MTTQEKVLIGKVDGIDTYLASPSWDCDWYWGFGYIQNIYSHTHCDSLSRNKNMFDAMVEYFDKDTITLSKEKLWTFCELMSTFYTLKKVAELYHRGSSGYTKNPLYEILKNDTEYNRITKELMPKIFDEIYKLF